MQEYGLKNIIKEVAIIQYDLTNLKYGKWVVLDQSGKAKNGQKLWRCKCECGNIRKVQQGHLRSGHSKSCGKCNIYKTTGTISSCIGANGKSFIFDTSDLPIVMQYTWHVDSNGYPSAYYHGKSIKLHRMLLNPQKKVFVDHIDRNPLNNCRKNLRVCSSHENCFNQGLRSDNRTGYKGVKYDGRYKRFIARIGINNKRITIGRFDSAIEAAKAYNQKAMELFGEYAFLNTV